MPRNRFSRRGGPRGPRFNGRRRVRINPNNNFLSIIRGGKRNARNNPRPISMVPWNPLHLQWTVAIADSTTTNFSVGNIDTQTRNKYGLQAFSAGTSSTYLVFEIDSVTVHDLNGRAIGLQLANGTLENGEDITNPIASGQDFPGRNSWASVTCRYPSHLAHTSYSQQDTTSGSAVLFQIVSGANIVSTATGTTNVLVTLAGRWRMYATPTVGLTTADLSSKSLPEPKKSKPSH